MAGFLCLVVVVAAALAGLACFWTLPSDDKNGYFVCFCATVFVVLSTEVALTVVTQCALWLISITRKGALGTQPPAHTVSEPAPLTVLVVPALLNDDITVRRLLHTLESHAESNWAPNIFFGLLTDFSDFAFETAPNDEKLLAAAMRGIDTLNDRWNAENGPRFFLLHRFRLWAPAQITWMGHERKRGKLNELNEYLVTGKLGSFSVAHGAVEAIVGARFVITLDEDNFLSPGGARALVSQMLREENVPIVDDRRRVVVGGHGILQPLVTLPSAVGSPTWYQRLQIRSWPGPNRVELLYHLLFGEGTFWGKGIYCVQTARTVLLNRLPDDEVLSHDIIEGCYLRSDLVTHTEVSESPPKNIELEMKRNHRWIRGDWQIFASQCGGRKPLSLLSRWKLADCPKRALVPCGMFVLLLGAIAHATVGWRLLQVVVFLRLVEWIVGWFPPRTDKVLGSSDSTGWRERAYKLACMVLSEGLYFSLLPSLAWNSFSAIATALWRIGWSRKRTLEWETTSAAENRASDGLCRQFVVLKANIVAVILLLAIRGPQPLDLSAPGFAIMTFWLLSPLLSWKLAKPAHALPPPASECRGDPL